MSVLRDLPITLTKKTEERQSIDIDNTVEALLNSTDREISKKFVTLIVQAIASYQTDKRKPDGTYLKLIQVLKEEITNNNNDKDLSNEEFEDYFFKNKYK